MIATGVFLALVSLVHNFIPYLQRHFQPDLSWYLGGVPPGGIRNIEPMRILHFLVLAYFVTGVVRQLEQLAPALRGVVAALAGPVARCGRHSLTGFARGIVLSCLGSFVIAALGDQVAVWAP